MRKFLTIAIPILTIILFICIMQSSRFLKKSFGKDDDIAQCIEKITEMVEQDDWEDARKGVDDLDKAWEKVKTRVQFSAERDEVNNITTNIARLSGAIEAEDQGNAFMELKACYNHWENIGK